jgi:hypothetical protein
LIRHLPISLIELSWLFALNVGPLLDGFKYIADSPCFASVRAIDTCKLLYPFEYKEHFSRGKKSEAMTDGARLVIKILNS